METQDPQSQPCPLPICPADTSCAFMTRGHRRAHSEVFFRLTDHDMSLFMMDPMNAGGSDDDLFSTYIDLDKLNSSDGHTKSTTDPSEGKKLTSSSSRPRLRHSSVDGEVMEAKKLCLLISWLNSGTLIPNVLKGSFFLSFFNNISILHQSNVWTIANCFFCFFNKFL